MDRNEVMRQVKWLFIFLLVAAGVAGAILFYNYFIKIEPGPLLESALSKAHQAKSYSYTLNSDLNIGGKKQKWIKVQGEQAEEFYHFYGETLGTPVEIYQIGMRSYTKDPVSGQWTILDGVDLSTQQLYMAEIDPLSSFQFKNIGDPLLLGKEKVDNIKCVLLELGKPKVESKYMEIWWKDFTYRFWIDRRKEQLVKAEITAVSTQSSDTYLTMTVDFKDFNKKVRIAPPI